MSHDTPCDSSNGMHDMAHPITCHVTRHMMQYGGEVRRCLPRADDSGARKKTLWKTLFEGFDQIDGKPTQADKEVCESA